ncbi:23S rRNA (cytidine1920-2'-O)/16S rRNA (cytidine1409-2'-O)-methyltransferase [Edaphobacter lichenicola]|uniref:23S rRNA (Cytidine1920-2'-O)/16S rRNA (Cytidine1409-2'-O)-methyltransferase n=2 Tax=Tunturiibacter TaxID=3154218 RepID=A0A7W8N3G3_9BACT|nr:23S rRNA (cytidine1920-2'-O)/16S rRNA (cytidine1409-2'-O)-methyltransferase [Edaphobacter lichenicola]
MFLTINPADPNMSDPTPLQRNKSPKSRIDKLLVDQGHAASRERAQALILAGRVLVDEQRIDKPGTSISSDAVIRLLGSDLKYVSRGGLKLERALAHWSINLTNLPCVDIGASTGGFTDCMLQSGAASVLAVDTGYGQIAHKLRDDPRVTLRERTNARLLTHGELLIPHTPTPAFLAMDVSFISATLVLPAVLAALSTPDQPWQGTTIILVKPQFEAGRANIGKGGIVRDPDARQAAIERVRDSVIEQHGTDLDLIDSPILGMEGNHEYLLHARFL